jgi:hypothetical protein
MALAQAQSTQWARKRRRWRKPHPPHQDATMVLSLLDKVECASDMINIMKAVDELQDFVSKAYTNGFKQSSSNSY